MDYDVVILGAGAAGMICAIEAARRGKGVLVLDHAKAAGEKIRISGGGRCNFTNLYISSEKFLSCNSKFALSALKRFTQWDFISMVEKAGISWHEKTLGQLFCDGSSKQIVEMLLDGMERAGADLRLNIEIYDVQRSDTGFRVETSGGVFGAASVVIATGGKSIPKMGATGLGYRIAEQFGLGVTETRAGLVPLTFGPHLLAETSQLSGLSVGARVTAGRTGFDEGLLFTHRGLSGPSILQASSYWKDGEMLSVDLFRGGDVASLLNEDRKEAGRMSVKNALARHVPEKLAGLIVAELGLKGNLADQSKQDLRGLSDRVHGWQVRPSGSEGYRTAEVTLGGVDTDFLDARTMVARDVPGLYFIGEVVDVTGWLGGYNFQWAWSSGWAAGQVC